MNWYKKAQFDDIEDVHYSIDDERNDILGEYFDKHHKMGTMMSWSLIPFAPLKKIWEDYAEFGFVRDEIGITSIANHMLKNLARIQASTELAGHSQVGMNSQFEDFGVKPPKGDKAFDFYNIFIETPYGTPISDYGLKPLWQLAEELMEARNAEDKLIAIDKMLNVVHQRGDLAALFVEGGTSSLVTLSSKEDFEKKREEEEFKNQPKEEPKEVVAFNLMRFKRA